MIFCYSILYEKLKSFPSEIHPRKLLKLFVYKTQFFLQEFCFKVWCHNTEYWKSSWFFSSRLVKCKQHMGYKGTKCYKTRHIFLLTDLKAIAKFDSFFRFLSSSVILLSNFNLKLVFLRWTHTICTLGEDLLIHNKYWGWISLNPLFMYNDYWGWIPLNLLFMYCKY